MPAFDATLSAIPYTVPQSWRSLATQVPLASASYPKSNGARQPSTLFYLSRRESQWSHRENREVSTSLHVGQCHTLQMLHSQPEKLGSDRGSRFFECLRLLYWLEKYVSEKLRLQTTTLLSGSHNPSFRVFQGLSGSLKGFQGLSG